MANMRKNVKKSYDEIAEIYNKKRNESKNLENEKNILNKFESKLPEKGKIFDAGCGGNPINMSDLEIVGLDFSRNQLMQYSEQNACLIQGDMIQLPFKDNIFTGGTAFYSLIHIPFDSHQKVIDEFARVVKKDSPLLITEGSKEWSGSNDSWLNTNEKMEWSMAGKNKTIKHLEKAGFKIITVEPIKDTLGSGTKMYILATLRD